MFAIIDLSNLTNETRPLINQAYRIWSETYTDILRESGEQLLPEHFYRSKLMTMVYEEDKVRAFTLHNIYDFSADGIADLAYFSPLSDSVRSKLISSQQKIFSCEWVTVHPEVRARFSKVQMGDVMMGLGCRTMIDTSCDAAMGFSRMDKKADKMAVNFGTENLDTIVRHGIFCGVMYLERQKFRPHPYAKTQETIENLYAKKINFSHLVNLKTGAA